MVEKVKLHPDEIKSLVKHEMSPNDLALAVLSEIENTHSILSENLEKLALVALGATDHPV